MTTTCEGEAPASSNDPWRRRSSHVWLHDLKNHALHRTKSPWRCRNEPKGSPTTQPSYICSAFPPSSHPRSPSLAAVDLGGYCWRTQQHLESLPDELLSVLTDQEMNVSDAIHPQLLRLWGEIAISMRSSEQPSIDSLISHLVDAGVLRSIQGREDTTIARNLIFAILGWQTMLFLPELGTCSSNELAIADEMDGYRGQGHIIFRQDQSACKRPLHQFLMGFGVLLPPSNFRPAGVYDRPDNCESSKSIQPASFNATLLESIGGITFKWVDNLSLHMELEQNMKVLYLFRYPSFCAENVIARRVPTQTRGAIHAFAAPPSHSNMCASIDDISKMLRETLRSYRLLFGQSKQARSLFRSMTPFDDIAGPGHDTFLAELCGRKRCQMVFAEDRDSYDLARHFPMYRSKLMALDQYMSKRRPRTWKELWQDKRDSAQWFTFWAVLILGGLGVVLTLIQVVLQIVEIARPNP